MTSSLALFESLPDPCVVLNWPAGVNSKLPSGAKVNRRKKEVKDSFAYRFAFLTPSPPNKLGDDTSIGLTAGNGKDGAGDADRRIEGEDPNDDRRL